ncbi:hypothetical protein FFWV33_15350 [Flavobacterium faecale]|uniref:Uncharacterized protein n=1 Tax=Flavobacterium faecale TaxID=1355330 RepID=A0A2S1LGC6_9FLAO|nr:hypothetical protein [Flavobacterium faecale]AWG22805.1 hypothetical protein FFWV33_15350 [Flavobacterium faecale]
MKKSYLFTTLLISGLALAQTAPTSTWLSAPPAKIESGETYALAAKFDSGDDGHGKKYNAKTTVQFSISEKAGNKYIWKAGVTIPESINKHAGMAGKDWKIPSLPPSSSLAPGTVYVMRVGFQNDNDAWAKASAEYEIIIGGSNSVPDALGFKAAEITLKAAEKLEIPITYSSETDIAVDGLKFTLWTITNPFSDVWHGLYSNKRVLPAGTNVSTTITINPPTSIEANNIIWPSDELASHDPNAKDDQYKAPIKNYFYQLRMIKGNDASFTPELKNVQTTLIITK